MCAQNILVLCLLLKFSCYSNCIKSLHGQSIEIPVNLNADIDLGNYACTSSCSSTTCLEHVQNLMTLSRQTSANKSCNCITLTIRFSV